MEISNQLFGLLRGSSTFENAIHGHLRSFHAPQQLFKRVSPKDIFFKSFGKSPSKIFGTSRISCSLIF